MSSLAPYAERGQTHREHTAEIQRLYGYREFSETRAEFESWLERRAWNRGDGPKVLFEAAWQWLLERRVLLPGITTLIRLVASIRERAAERLWETLARLIKAQTNLHEGLSVTMVYPPPERLIYQGNFPT